MKACAEVILIGFGNELRGDDGAGPHVARAVARWQLRATRVIACHQLVPEMAETIAHAAAVVFVDASLSDPEVTVRLLLPFGMARTPATHSTTPLGLLALAEVLYGATPAGFLVSIPATDVGFGPKLSPSTQLHVVNALEHIQRLLGQLRSASATPLTTTRSAAAAPDAGGPAASSQLDLAFPTDTRPGSWSSLDDQRRRALSELGQRLGLPLGHEVEVRLCDGVELRGRLAPRRPVMCVPEQVDPQFELQIGRATFFAREIEACVRVG